MMISASQRSCFIFSFTGTTTGNDIFKAPSDAIDAMALGWDKLCGVATDGAPAMTGERKGMALMVFDKVRESGGEAFKFHCIIHQEASVQRQSSLDMSSKLWLKPFPMLSLPISLPQLIFPNKCFLFLI